MALAKRMKTWKAKLPPGKQYPIDEALKLVKEFSTAKFNETVDCSVNLGIDASKSDQQVRGSTVMPHGTGKTLRVAVFTAGKNVELAKAAGADSWLRAKSSMARRRSIALRAPTCASGRLTPLRSGRFTRSPAWR